MVGTLFFQSEIGNLQSEMPPPSPFEFPCSIFDIPFPLSSDPLRSSSSVAGGEKCGESVRGICAEEFSQPLSLEEVRGTAEGEALPIE